MSAADDGRGGGGAPTARRVQALEWVGVVSAIVYSLLVASNIGAEFVGFALLMVSSVAIGVWARMCGHRGMLLLQFFYATAALIGMVRWF